MKHKTSKKKSKGMKTSKSPGEERRSNILARIGYFKEDAIITAVIGLMSAISACKQATDDKTKAFFIRLVTKYISYISGFIISSGLYMLYFEVAKFGWPKEKSWIKFRRVLNYIGLAVMTTGYLGANIFGIEMMDPDKIGENLLKLQ